MHKITTDMMYFKSYNKSTTLQNFKSIFMMNKTAFFSPDFADTCMSLSSSTMATKPTMHCRCHRAITGHVTLALFLWS